MNSDDLGVSSESSFNIDPERDTQEHHRKKYLLQVGVSAAAILMLLTIITAFLYVLIRNKNATPSSVVNINLTTPIPLETSTVTFDDLSTTDKIEATVIVLNPCIEQSVHYRMSGEPWQNYSLYSIDASLLIPSALISFTVTIYPPNIGCTWSLDVFPMDGRPIPLSGSPTNSVFGLYDQNQDSTVENLNVSNLTYWSGGNRKFIVGITGAWFGTAGIGCQGNGTMTICFSQP